MYPPLLEDEDAGVALRFESISGQKQAELSSEESHRLFEAVLYAFPVPMFVIGRDHHILGWNLAMEKVSGLKTPGVLGTRRQLQAFYPAERSCLSDLVVDEVTDRIPDWFPETGPQPENPEGAFTAEEVQSAPGGGNRRFRQTVTSVTNKDGTMIAAIERVEEIFHT